MHLRIKHREPNLTLNTSGRIGTIAAVCSAIATISIAAMAYYAAFHSPLKDAFQAELKFEALEARNELETVESRFEEIALEAEQLGLTNQLSKDALIEQEAALFELQGQILSDVSAYETDLSLG